MDYDKPDTIVQAGLENIIPDIRSTSEISLKRDPLDFVNF
jgi:hypothetical protein